MAVTNTNRLAATIRNLAVVGVLLLVVVGLVLHHRHGVVQPGSVAMRRTTSIVAVVAPAPVLAPPPAVELSEANVDISATRSC